MAMTMITNALVMILRNFFIVQVAIATVIVGEDREHFGEYCNTEVFKAECQGQNEVILMTSARYGRMKVGRCVEYHLGYIDCFSDVIKMMDRRCSGKKSCTVRVPDAEFESTGPCLKELKTYLEAGYRCIEVHSPHLESSSCSPLMPTNLTSSVGFISMATPSPIGATPSTSSCSWWIAAKPGQTINLTLYDFFFFTSEETQRDQRRRADQSDLPPPPPPPPTPPSCLQLGWLNDLPLSNKLPEDGASLAVGDVPICAGKQRVTPFYSSKSHSVRLWLHFKSDDPTRHYLIEYSDGKNDAGRLNSSFPDVVISYGLAIAIGAVIGVLIATGIVLVVGLVRDKRESSQGNSATCQRSNEVHGSVGRDLFLAAFKKDDTLSHLAASTSLNYERRHSPNVTLSFQASTRDSKAEQTFIDGRERQTRYVVREGALSCPHHRLHGMTPAPGEGAPPMAAERRTKGRCPSSHSDSQERVVWTEQQGSASNDQREEFIQTDGPKLAAPIFTVVDSTKRQEQQHQQHACFC